MIGEDIQNSLLYKTELQKGKKKIINHFTNALGRCLRKLVHGRDIELSDKKQGFFFLTEAGIFFLTVLFKVKFLQMNSRKVRETLPQKPREQVMKKNM